jgi:hypothetical protein
MLQGVAMGANYLLKFKYRLPATIFARYMLVLLWRRASQTHTKPSFLRKSSVFLPKTGCFAVGKIGELP